MSKERSMIPIFLYLAFSPPENMKFTIQSPVRNQTHFLDRGEYPDATQDPKFRKNSKKKKPFCANPAPSPQRNGAQKRALQITTGVQEGLRFPCRHFLAGVHGRHCNH
ncbi:hypothetical protein CEXT_324961 [Caerostris extrusa]|uniref:Uncharacterized protein n=1 Tax=Caerostris extrusa TaxID=172846 RepID=A0AAV4V400_CAEEX|nr:hypothetical protein CEXT_324961 [Caerostris extrusa]